MIDRFGLDADTDPRWLHLPLRCGGFGLFSPAQLQHAAIVGAVAGFLASAELFISPFEYYADGSGGMGTIGTLQTVSCLIFLLFFQNNGLCN